MSKRRVNFYLDEETIALIREISVKEDKKQNALIKDAIQCYLILNAKNREDEKQ